MPDFTHGRLLLRWKQTLETRVEPFGPSAAFIIILRLIRTKSGVYRCVVRLIPSGNKRWRIVLGVSIHAGSKIWCVGDSVERKTYEGRQSFLVVRVGLLSPNVPRGANLGANCQPGRTAERANEFPRGSNLGCKLVSQAG